MNSKKAQSEIITTVLIILLVLAAIVIVWQVVQGTLKQGKGQIDTGSACIGVQTDVISAKSAETLGSCLPDTTKKTKAACTATTPPGTWTNGANGEVVVQRSSGTADPKYTTTAKLYIGGVDIGLPQSSALTPMSTATFIPTAAQLTTPGMKVKAVTFLTDTGGNIAACPVATEVEAQ